MTATEDSTPVELSIAIPAYLEAESLAMLLPSVKAAAAALTREYEILVVDTQQPMDRTAEVCAANSVRHIYRIGGDCFGDALRTIIANARGQYVLTLDADGSHNPAYIAAMWAARTRADIVIGSRYIAGGRSDNPMMLTLMSRVLNLVFRMAFSIDARDVSGNFRLYHRDVVTPLRLESNDFDIVEEILIKARMRNPGLRIVEVPITFDRRHAGESKRKLFTFILGYVKTIQRLRRYARTAQTAQETKR